MSANQSTPAERLLHVARPFPDMPTPSDADVDLAVREFRAQLTILERKHAANKVSDQYLIGQVFNNPRQFKNDAERASWCRNHLRIAIRQFEILCQSLLDPSSNTITLARLTPWTDVVVDYLFDLNEVVPFLEKRTPGYIFLRGMKNSDVHSWEVFLLSRGLAFQAAPQSGPLFDHKAAQIAAIFILRQALELRFERLIGVYLEDRKGKEPRLKHGFHQNFIVAHPQFYRCRGFEMRDLRPVYDWCSGVVHQAYQPFGWQIAWALEICGQLLGTHRVPRGAAWSIANGVEVMDVVAMQSAFEGWFLRNYDHGAWRMTRTRPEALVRNWDVSMATTAPDYRSVARLPDWRERLLKLLPFLRRRRH